MRNDSVVSGHPKSTGIPLVDELSTGPPDLGCYNLVSELRSRMWVSTSMVLILARFS